MQIDDKIKITDILLMNESFENWIMEFESPNNEYRLYVVKNIKDEGFEFIALRLNNYIKDDNDGWNNTSIVDELFRGKGIFDGVRHLSLNTYIHCPSFESMSKMMEIIGNIEKEICSEC